MNSPENENVVREKATSIRLENKRGKGEENRLGKTLGGRAFRELTVRKGDDGGRGKSNNCEQSFIAVRKRAKENRIKKSGDPSRGGRSSLKSWKKSLGKTHHVDGKKLFDKAGSGEPSYGTSLISKRWSATNNTEGIKRRIPREDSHWKRSITSRGVTNGGQKTLIPMSGSRRTAWKILSRRPGGIR